MRPRAVPRLARAVGRARHGGPPHYRLLGRGGGRARGANLLQWSELPGPPWLALLSGLAALAADPDHARRSSDRADRPCLPLADGPAPEPPRPTGHLRGVRAALCPEHVARREEIRPVRIAGLPRARSDHGSRHRR